MNTCPHCRNHCGDGKFCQHCGKPVDRFSVYDPKSSAYREMSVDEMQELIKSAEQIKKLLTGEKS